MFSKKKLVSGIKSVFRSFSGIFHACYILKTLSTFLTYKITQVALLYDKNT